MGDENRPRPRRSWTGWSPLLRQGLVEGAARDEQRSDLPAGHVRRHRGAGRVCARSSPSTAATTARTPARTAQGALEAYAEMVDVARRSGCALHLTHATMNFEPNRGRGAELLALVDAALADGVDVTLDTYPYLAGLHDAQRAAAQLGARRRHPRSAATALGPRRPASASPTSSRSSGPTAATAARSTGPRSRSAGSANPDRAPTRSGGRSPSSARRPGAARSRSTSTCWWATGPRRRSCSTSGTSRTSARSCGTRGTAAARTRSWSATRPHPRAWGTFPRYLGHYARDAGRAGPGRVRPPPHRAAGRAAAADATAAWSGRATPPTWCCSTRRPCGTPRRSSSHASRPSGSSGAGQRRPGHGRRTAHRRTARPCLASNHRRRPLWGLAVQRVLAWPSRHLKGLADEDPQEAHRRAVEEPRSPRPRGRGRGQASRRRRRRRAPARPEAVGSQYPRHRRGQQARPRPDGP